MTDIRFYHMERQTLEDILPALLKKARENGHRIVVKVASAQDAESLNKHLWSCDDRAFLPHGSAKDGHPEKHPIWITDLDENPNEADVLILTQGTTSEDYAQYKMCCEMLDGRNIEAVQGARKRWKSYGETGEHNITYWQQGDKGWEKKA